MANLRVSLINFLGYGHEFTKHGDELLRDTLSFECDGYKIKIVQKSGLNLSDVEAYTGKQVVTSDVFVQDVESHHVPAVLKIVERLGWMLSFASSSKVVYHQYEYPDGSGLTHKHRVIGEASYFRPALEIRDGACTLSFINSCYDTYKLLEEQRKLNVVVDYLVVADRPGQPYEISLLAAFIILESLKSTYAEAKGIKGDFLSLVRKMFKEAGMEVDFTDVRNLRNEIIHEGKSALSYDEQWRIYGHAQDHIREYLLRLLNYSGYFFLFGHPDMLTKKI